MFDLKWSKLKTLGIRIFQANRLFFQFTNWKYHLSLDYRSNEKAISVFKEVFYHNSYNRSFPKGIKQGVIVDIGAHFGYFSIFASRNVSNEVIIFAIEPSDENFGHLMSNINASKINNITPLQLGISGTSSTRSFYNSMSWNHSLYADYLPSMQESHPIQCITLKDFIDANHIEIIHFLKIDCEGAEHEIFQNSDVETLQKIQTISMEIHDMSHCGFDSDQTIKVLTEAGFKILYSDYQKKKSNHPKGYNAKMILSRNTLL